MRVINMTNIKELKKIAKDKKIEIYEMYGLETAGSADIYRNIIYLHKGLREFPELQLFVLRHEMQHIKEHSYLKAILLDVKDYVELASREDLWQFYQKYMKTPFLHQSRDFLYKIILIGFIAPYATIIGEIKMLIGKNSNKHRKVM